MTYEFLGSGARELKREAARDEEVAALTAEVAALTAEVARLQSVLESVLADQAMREALKLDKHEDKNLQTKCPEAQTCAGLTSTGTKLSMSPGT